jgi:hypothetical protein
MSLTDQIYAQALVLIRDLEDGDDSVLEVLCRTAEVSLRAKLRDGVTPNDCKADFIAAASLYAISGFSELRTGQSAQSDLTGRYTSGDAGACCLRYQAELLMMPYMKDNFSFVSV